MSMPRGFGPPNYGRYVELLRIALRVLKLSKVKRGERLIVHTDTRKNKDITDAFFAAAAALTTDPTMIITCPRKTIYGEPPMLAVESMKRADMVIDLITVPWLYTHAHNEILEAGARILTSATSEDAMIMMPPSKEVAERTKKLAQMVNKTETMRITSDQGTDLTMNRGERQATVQDGLVSEPGEWDNFPSNLLCLAPIEESVSGTLIISPGDKICVGGITVSGPIKCRVENGRLVEIDGGIDARRLKNWFESWDDPNMYVFAHTGFGCDHRADINSFEVMAWESYLGGVFAAFGSNYFETMGGKNVARSHNDIILLGTTVYLDEKPVIKNGKFMIETLKT